MRLRRHRIGRSVVARGALVALCVLAWGASGAQAGEYHVYGCRMPDGQVAPADGWSGTKSGAFRYVEDKV